MKQQCIHTFPTAPDWGFQGTPDHGLGWGQHMKAAVLGVCMAPQGTAGPGGAALDAGDMCKEFLDQGSFVQGITQYRLEGMVSVWRRGWG